MEHKFFLKLFKNFLIKHKIYYKYLNNLYYFRKTNTSIQSQPFNYFFNTFEWFRSVEGLYFWAIIDTDWDLYFKDILLKVYLPIIITNEIINDKDILYFFSKIFNIKSSIEKTDILTILNTLNGKKLKHLAYRLHLNQSILNLFKFI